MARTVKKQKQPQQKCVSNPFAWVEVPVTNMDRAKTFYGKLFGYKFQMQEMYGYQLAMFPMTMESNGAGGALVCGPSYTPSYDGAVVYFAVDNIRATLKKATSIGGRIIQDKKSIGQYGFIAYFEDSEGNRMALHQRPDQ